MNATASIDTQAYDLIVATVGETEAANIDLDQVLDFDGHAARGEDIDDPDALTIGDPAWDGVLSVLPDDTVHVWAQGDVATTATIPGAYEHFSARRSATMLAILNGYRGDNIWEDIIYGLDLDEDATDERDPNVHSGVFVLADGRIFECEQGTWSVRA